MLLIFQGDTPVQHAPEPSRLSSEERSAIFHAHRRVMGTPGVHSGFQLQPPETATTVRVERGEALTTDGPFVEMKEAVGGYVVSRHRPALSRLSWR